jgi:serine/threonine protein kinase
MHPEHMHPIKLHDIASTWTRVYVAGQFGDVCKAVLETSDHEEGIVVAVKSVKHSTAKERQNFVREMCVMSKMLHPNIVRLYGLVLKGSI